MRRVGDSAAVSFATQIEASDCAPSAAGSLQKGSKTKLRHDPAVVLNDAGLDSLVNLPQVASALPQNSETLKFPSAG